MTAARHSRDHRDQPSAADTGHHGLSLAGMDDCPRANRGTHRFNIGKVGPIRIVKVADFQHVRAPAGTESLMSEKREREIGHFKGFLELEPEFCGEPLAEWGTPDDEKDFPDVKGLTTSGKKVGVEIGEWLNE